MNTHTLQEKIEDEDRERERDNNNTRIFQPFRYFTYKLVHVWSKAKKTHEHKIVAWRKTNGGRGEMSVLGMSARTVKHTVEYSEMSASKWNSIRNDCRMRKTTLMTENSISNHIILMLRGWECVWERERNKWKEKVEIASYTQQ